MKKQTGIAEGWVYLIVVVGLVGGAWLMYDTVDARAFKRGKLEGRAEVQAELNKFKADVDAAAEKAYALRRQQEEADAKRKEKVDAEIRRLNRQHAADLKRLRDARAKGGSGVVPKPTPETRDPERITFDRAELDRALRESLDQLLSGVEELLREGQAAVDALNALRR